MEYILSILLLLPLLSAAIAFWFNNKEEKAIYTISTAPLIINLILILFLGINWIVNGYETLYSKGPVLYQTQNAEFSVNLFLDGYSYLYILVSTTLIGMVSIFSKYYMHREKGYKRFFTNLIFFYFGLSLVVLSGNFETLFIGWEVLGVTSFFLIGFYRERYLPVKNALKVVSLYRVADIALLIGIWICHHYFGHSINFNEPFHISDRGGHGSHDIVFQMMIPGVFLLAAMVKSGQFPFSSWLPRAMEGPTTSSAVFYGSLSVHIGVFLLIRTAPLWEDNVYFKVAIATIGLITSLLATTTARVQSSIKTQIAYSAIAQIGIMFIEVSLGFYWLAMIHFASNAFLRSYQLLVSPSVLSYRIHDQFFNFIPPLPQHAITLWDKIKLNFYVLSIKEFNLDRYMYRFLWRPLKKLGNLFNILPLKLTYILFIAMFILGLYGVYHQDIMNHELQEFAPTFFAIMGMVLILKSFVERRSSYTSWFLIIINQLYLSLSIGFNEQFDFSQVHIYLSGIFVSGIIGWLVIRKLENSDENISLNNFHGHSYQHPRLAFVFAIACLGLAGFPITPTFIGEDLMMGHIHENQYSLLILTVLNLILDGLVIFRIYSRLFLGPHDKGYHEFSYRSA